VTVLGRERIRINLKINSKKSVKKNRGLKTWENTTMFYRVGPNFNLPYHRPLHCLLDPPRVVWGSQGHPRPRPPWRAWARATAPGTPIWLSVSSRSVGGGPLSKAPNRGTAVPFHGPHRLPLDFSPLVGFATTPEKCGKFFRSEGPQNVTHNQLHCFPW